MFGFGTGKTNKMLIAAILNASENCLGIYKNGLLDLFQKYSDDIGEEAQNDFSEIRKQYLDEAANAAFDVFKAASPSVYQRILMLLCETSLTGFEFDIDGDFTAGKTYAILHMAFHNKPAKPGEYIALNHAQNNIMEKALAELDQLQQREC